MLSFTYDMAKENSPPHQGTYIDVMLVERKEIGVKFRFLLNFGMQGCLSFDIIDIIA